MDFGAWISSVLILYCRPLRKTIVGNGMAILAQAITIPTFIPIAWRPGFVLVIFFCSQVRRRTMRAVRRRGWTPAPDGWVQIVRGPRPPSESWSKVARSATSVQVRPNEVRSSAGRWRQPQPVRSSVSRDRGAGSQKTCRGDRGRIGSSGSSGDNRWPEVQVSKAKRSAQERPGSADQPDGVASREGKETLDCPRRSTSGTRDRCRGKRSSPRNVSVQLQLQPNRSFCHGRRQKRRTKFRTSSKW